MHAWLSNNYRRIMVAPWLNPENQKIFLPICLLNLFRIYWDCPWISHLLILAFISLICWCIILRFSLQSVQCLPVVSMSISITSQSLMSRLTLSREPSSFGGVSCDSCCNHAFLRKTSNVFVGVMIAAIPYSNNWTKE